MTALPPPPHTRANAHREKQQFPTAFVLRRGTYHVQGIGQVIEQHNVINGLVHFCVVQLQRLTHPHHYMVMVALIVCDSTKLETIAG